MFAALAAAVAASVAPGPPPSPVPAVETLGRSVEGRPIRVRVIGEEDALRRVLVVGVIHGNETAGLAVTRRLVRTRAPDGLALWVVHVLNPDGVARGTRQNARGVDLNRNFPAGWIGRRWDPTYSGPRPLSEPESRIARRLILRIRPDATTWFHQAQALVRAWSGPSLRAARRYARVAGLPFRRLGVPPGAATRWQSSRFRRAPAFVVELPPGPLSARAAARHARAVLAVGRH